MPQEARSYDADRLQERSWQERFPSWAIGFAAWVDQPPPEHWTPERNPLRSLPPLAERDGPGTTPLACPRLFVSHRSTDRDAALRVAWLAARAGFLFWLDVLDPNLARLARLAGRLSRAQHALATAAIIEMGLLNCSHVLALITPRTRGTMWVPYEYGRVKDVPFNSIRAGCWRHPQLHARRFPEYLRLGTITRSEGEILAWLTAERQRWTHVFQRCRDGAPDTWPASHPEPPELEANQALPPAPPPP